MSLENLLKMVQQYEKLSSKASSSDLSKVADSFESKLAQKIEQTDIGTGETQAIVAAAGNQIKRIVASAGDALGPAVAYIQFTGTVTAAPNFAPKSVNLEAVEVFASYDEPIASMATKASDAIMANLKGTIEGALLKFYKTPAGLAILKVSGTPPNLKVVIKWKWK